MFCLDAIPVSTGTGIFAFLNTDCFLDKLEKLVFPSKT